jgi:6-phosphogluconate dehydrogenase (decarboxylating)
MSVAVLGLGRMGPALAGRLIDCGDEVTVWNRTRGRADDLLARGAREAPSLADASRVRRPSWFPSAVTTPSAKCCCPTASRSPGWTAW